MVGVAYSLVGGVRARGLKDLDLSGWVCVVDVG